jgi:transcriptional regulator with XRE-family HTH domain
MNEIDKIIGQNIKNHREQRCLTQNDLATRLREPLSYQQIQKYEAGKNRVSAGLLVEFASLLCCNVTDLIAGVSEELEGKCTRLADPINSDKDFNKLAADYSKLSDDYKDIIRKLAKAMTKKVCDDLRADYNN